ncbi:MAG: PEGA domain-containing protein [Bradymonadia bacterium]
MDLLFRFTIFAIAMLCTAVVNANEGSKAGVLALETQRNRSSSKVVATEMTRAVRSAIRGQRGLKDVGKLSASLSDARDAFGCQPDDTTCMRELAKTLGVGILVWGTVDSASDHTKVTLWATSTNGEQGKLKVKIKPSASSKTYRSIAKKLLMMVVKKRKEKLTTVNINTIPPGAFIRVGGKSIGISPVTVRLRTGRYDAEASLEGYALLESALTVSSNKEQSVDWVLQTSGITGTASTEDSNTRLRNTIRWTSLGVALASLATTAYFANETELATSQTLERLACNDMTYINPEACGEQKMIAFINESEYAKQKEKYNFNKTLMVSSLVITTIASSVFGATFLF